MSEDILRGIENKTLRNLLTLWYNIFYNMEGSQIARKIYGRMRENEPYIAFTPENIALGMSAKDVASLIGVSERQAYNYVQTFRIIYAGPTKALARRKTR